MSPRTNQQLAQLRAERKEQIVRAALEVFSRKGFHATNVSDVAVKAEVSQGTIYHYFPSKDELFLAAYEFWEVQSLYEEIRHVLNVSKSPGEQLRILARTVGERMNQAAFLLPANVEFWSHISRNEHIQKKFGRIFTKIRAAVSQIIKNGIAQGEFADVDAEQAAAIMVAVYDGLILQWLADPQSVNWETISEILIQLVLKGLLKNQK